MSEFAEKVRSIAAPRSWGQPRKKPVFREDTGERAGYHLEHWNGRQDAVAQPTSLRVKLAMKEDG